MKMCCAFGVFLSVLGLSDVSTLVEGGRVNSSGLPGATAALRGRRTQRERLILDSEHAALNQTLPHFNAKDDLPARDHPLLWIHIHKAAGSYICHMAQVAGEDIVRPNANCNLIGHDGYGDSGHPERTMTCQQRAQLFRRRMWTFGAIERELYDKDLCFQQFDYGILLREPLDLMHSEMNYRAAQNAGTFGKGMVTALRMELAKPNPPPAGRQQWGPWKFFDNIQTRLLANALNVPAGQINESHLRIARARLAKFRLVARVEDLRSSIRKKAIFTKLGWRRAHVFAPDKRINKVNVDRYHFTASEKAWLANVNKYDLQLYRSVVPAGEP